MKRIIALSAAPILMIGLGACGQSNSKADHAVCVNPATYVPYDLCDPSDDDYRGPGWGQWMIMSHSQYQSWHSQPTSKRHVPVRGLRAARPSDKVRFGDSKKVTVYSKQAGTPIKKNQDARPVSSVGGKSSFGSTSKKSGRR